MTDGVVTRRDGRRLLSFTHAKGWPPCPRPGGKVWGFPRFPRPLGRLGSGRTAAHGGLRWVLSEIGAEYRRREKGVTMRRVTILAVSGVLLIALPAVPVHATPPEEVLIEVDTTLPEVGPTFGPFTATGPLCPSGDSIDVSSRFVGFQSGNRAQILVAKQFTCDDQSGSFVLLLRVHLQFQPFSDVFTWSVVEGTGAYDRLHGSGDGFGVPSAIGVFDTFTGAMHFD